MKAQHVHNYINFILSYTVVLVQFLICTITDFFFLFSSDVNGLGYILSINRMPMVYVAQPFLGNKLGSYGLNFTVQLAVVSAAALRTEGVIIR